MLYDIIHFYKKEGVKMIDKSSGIPIYIQIQGEIKQKIENGTWQVGKAIPAERQLARCFM